MTNTEQRVYMELSLATIIKFMAVLAFFVLLYLLRDVAVIFIFALVIASAITPFANWLEAKGFPRVFGVLILYFVVFGLAVLVLSLIIPFISQELTQLTAQLPKVVDRVSDSLDDVQSQSPRYFDFLGELQNLLSSFTGYLQQFSQSAFGLVVSIFGGLFSFLAILVISFYLSIMKGGIEAFLKSFIPTKFESYIVDLWKRAEIKVGRWLQGQLLLALIVGLIVFIGLSLMGVKYALLLGVLSMVLEIVPIAGPVLAAIPAVILSLLSDNPSMGIWVALFYLVVQQLENHVLTPIILGKTTGLNPVTVIISLLIGFNLAGITGMLLAVPVATIIVEIFDDMARQKELKRNSS